jgi:hypothetical protein
LYRSANFSWRQSRVQDRRTQSLFQSGIAGQGPAINLIASLHLISARALPRDRCRPTTLRWGCRHVACDVHEPGNWKSALLDKQSALALPNQQHEIDDARDKQRASHHQCELSGKATGQEGFQSFLTSMAKL